MSFSSQLPALVGVALGGTLSWGFSSLTEEHRFRRQARAAWEERRLSAYADYSAAAKRTMSILFRAASLRGFDSQTEPIALEDARPLLSQAFHEREDAFERMRLSGSDPVIRAAREWVAEIYTLRRLVEAPEATRETWQSQVALANSKRDAYYDVARAEVGLPLLGV